MGRLVREVQTILPEVTPREARLVGNTSNPHPGKTYW